MPSHTDLKSDKAGQMFVLVQLPHTVPLLAGCATDVPFDFWLLGSEQADPFIAQIERIKT